MGKKGILGLFAFESKKAREARMRAYENRMFPFGLNTQRDWEIRTIKKGMPNFKDPAQLHYSLLMLRENLYNTLLPEDNEDHLTFVQAMKMWEKQSTTKFLKPEQVNFVRSMAILENAADSYEKLPTIDDIKKHMEMYNS